MERNQENRDNRIPENDPSKPMDSKREVEQSNDEKTDQDFPGYPHYPAREDIMDEGNDCVRGDVDVENIPNSNRSGVSQRFLAGQNNERGEGAGNTNQDQEDDLNIREGIEGDVTNDDLTALGSTDAQIGRPQNVSNEDINTDLHVPGSELDDENEVLGAEDEQNNY